MPVLNIDQGLTISPAPALPCSSLYKEKLQPYLANEYVVQVRFRSGAAPMHGQQQPLTLGIAQCRAPASRTCRRPSTAALPCWVSLMPRLHLWNEAGHTSDSPAGDAPHKPGDELPCSPHLGQPHLTLLPGLLLLLSLCPRLPGGCCRGNPGRWAPDAAAEQGAPARAGGGGPHRGWLHHPCCQGEPGQQQEAWPTHHSCSMKVSCQLSIPYGALSTV